MSIFDFLKKKDDNSPAKEDLTKAKEHFDKGEFQETLRALTWGFRKDVNYKPLYQLAADCFGKLNAPDEQNLFTAVCKNQNDSNAYNDLGNSYFLAGYYDLAQVFYEKVIKLNPVNVKAPRFLAISYARRFQISKAIEVLTNAKSNNFWILYFLNKYKILDKKVDGVQEALNNLQSFLEEHPDQVDIDIPKIWIDELRETLQRFNTIPNIQTHIRDWQFIQYGGVVLDCIEEGDEAYYAAGGRYVVSWGSDESIKAIANKLKQFTDSLLISFHGIVSFKDRDSEIIGRLLAKEFGISFNFYEPTDSNQDCLIVSSDSSFFAEHEELKTIHNGQIVFSAKNELSELTIKQF